MVSVQVDAEQEKFLMRFRQGLLMMLGAVEDYLQIERTKEPNHKLRERLIQN